MGSIHTSDDSNNRRVEVLGLEKVGDRVEDAFGTAQKVVKKELKSDEKALKKELKETSKA